MKAEDLLKQAMSEQKLSDEARERILSGALKSMPENAPEANKKTFFKNLKMNYPTIFQKQNQEMKKY